MVPIAIRSLGELDIPTFYGSFYGPRLPLHVIGMAVGWKATKWTETYLKSKLGRKRVKVYYNESAIFDYNAKATTGIVRRYTMTFADAFDLMKSDRGGSYYIQQQDLRRELPELLPDVDQPSLLDRWRMIDATNIWIGGRGCKTPLHFDKYENFLVQIYGRKQVTLFPPGQSENLYPARGDVLEHCSRVNFFAPNLSLHPLFPEAEKHKTQLVLEPCDALYIPAGWWHAVESLERSISLNFWWRSLI
jgi:hypothetical protein